MSAPSITNDEKRACARRELAYRRRVYGRLVAYRKMSQQDADHEIACMAAILADYPEPDLFTAPEAES